MQTTIDSAGRVVIPIAIRREAGLRPGTRLEVSYRHGRVAIEPVPGEIRLGAKTGRVTASAPDAATLTAAEVQGIIEDVREGRG